MKDVTIKWDGERIIKPGLYSGMGIDIYHRPDICADIDKKTGKKVPAPSCSSSMLRAMNPDIGSMAHFFAYWPGNPNHVRRKISRAFIVGRAVHHLMLGEPFFAKIFCIQPDEYPDGKGELKPWSNNATFCREWHKKQAAAGRTVLTSDEVEAIKRMSASLAKHPHAKDWLSGHIERSFFWRDKETGIWLKWRPDAIPSADLDFCDLKTTHSVLWVDLMRTVRDYAYYQQGALGRTACREVLGRDMGTFTNLFIEKQEPFCARDVRIFDVDLDRGDRMNRACLRNFATGLKSGKWPGPGSGNEGNEKIGLSGDARTSIDKKLEMEGLADGND